MVLIDNETLAAVQSGFRSGGRAAALAELRRRFWLLDGAASDALDRLLALTPDDSGRETLRKAA